MLVNASFPKASKTIQDRALSPPRPGTAHLFLLHLLGERREILALQLVVQQLTSFWAHTGPEAAPQSPQSLGTAEPRPLAPNGTTASRQMGTLRALVGHHQTDNVFMLAKKEATYTAEENMKAVYTWQGTYTTRSQFDLISDSQFG